MIDLWLAAIKVIDKNSEHFLFYMMVWFQFHWHLIYFQDLDIFTAINLETLYSTRISRNSAMSTEQEYQPDPVEPYRLAEIFSIIPEFEGNQNSFLVSDWNNFQLNPLQLTTIDFKFTAKWLKDSPKQSNWHHAPTGLESRLGQMIRVENPKDLLLV